jgi:NHL repeat
MLGRAMVAALVGGLMLASGAAPAPPRGDAAAADPGTITTFAGNGRRPLQRDNRRATATGMQPGGVDTDADGNVYIADLGRIRKVAPDGVMTSIAGCAPRCNGRIAVRRSGPARVLSVSPSDVAVAEDGTVYAVDSTHVVRVRDGRATRIAGNYSKLGYADGRGRRARFKSATGIAIAPDGTLVVADRLNHRIRRVTPAGRVTTIAGTGRQGFSGDGGPATAARLNQPTNVAVDATGAIFVADHHNHRVRRIAPDGTITTIAGNGGDDPRPRNFDGLPATEHATTPFVIGVAVDGHGNVFVAGASRVGVIDSAGIFRTIANRRGRERHSGDGGPAIDAGMRALGALHVDAGGNLYVSAYRRIRLIERPLG